jgi:hypothetical protein
MPWGERKIINRAVAPSAPLSTWPIERHPMRKPKKHKKPLNDLSRSLTPFDPNQTIIPVVGLARRA